ncbi:pseudouridine synthase [Atractiella rhizophila]|nr:pseudouridine synthase [Atractiella rhizophila]
MPPTGPTPKLPLSALFALHKPSSSISMTLLNRLQPLFQQSLLFAQGEEGQGGSSKGDKKKGKWKKGRKRDSRVKIGQGGTLDPLADGVLVIGTNSSTKHLSKFLSSTKTYIATGLLGCSTDSYDSDGRVVAFKKWDHVSRSSVEHALSAFRGNITQVPPIYSALKMDGKPLYEYARSNTPLPKKIDARPCTVHSLELLSFHPGEEHAYRYPEKRLSVEERAEMRRVEELVQAAGVEGESASVGTVGVGVGDGDKDVVGVEEEEEGRRPPAFTVMMEVSSGTYVRSIIHDIGIALGSAAHVVRLTRTRQGEFVSKDFDPMLTDGKGDVDGEAVKTEDEKLFNAIPWSVFEDALGRLERGEKACAEKEGEWEEWEREILENCKS